MSKRKFKKVLFIDEDEEMLRIYHSILEGKELSGQLVYMAGARKGIDYIKQLKVKDLPDYVLLDLSIPHVGGFNFLQEFEALGKIKKRIEVYVCSSVINKNDRNSVMKYPFVSAFFEKPLPGDFLKLLIMDEVHPKKE